MLHLHAIMIIDILGPLRACVTGEFFNVSSATYYTILFKRMHKQCVPGVPFPPERLGTRLVCQ